MTQEGKKILVLDSCPTRIVTAAYVACLEEAEPTAEWTKARFGATLPSIPDDCLEQVYHHSTRPLVYSAFMAKQLKACTYVTSDSCRDNLLGIEAIMVVGQCSEARAQLSFLT